MTFIISFGFKGLPYISPNYEGNKDYVIRAKIRKLLASLGTIKKLFININTKTGRVMIEMKEDCKNNLEKTIRAINNAPLKMLKFSWEQPLLGMKTEKPYLSLYKSWLYLEANGSFEIIHNKLSNQINEEQLIHTEEYEVFLKNMEVSDQCDQWLLENEIKKLEKELLFTK
jgi:hypothetical protein